MVDLSERKLNDYFLNKLSNSYMLDILDEEELSGYLDDAEQMSEWGVSSPEDELRARQTQYSVPDVINDIVSPDYSLSPEDLKNLYKEVFSNKEYDLSDILGVFCSVALAAKRVNIPLSEESLRSCHLNKTAYPQGLAGEHQKTMYDISKWVHATRDIYSRINRTGKSFQQALSEVTAKWDKMEKLDYKHWLKFYSEGVPAKYPKLAEKDLRIKKADFYSEDGKFMLPLASLPQPKDEEEVKPKKDPVADRMQVRDSIEAHRKKILGRLSAAERLLCSLEGQSFAGEEQEFMLKLLQDLKRKVQTANKISIKSSLFEDYIYRTANYAGELGSKKGKYLFSKIAQADPFADPFAGAIPPAQQGGSTQVGSGSGDYNISTEEAFARFEERFRDGLFDERDKEEFEEELRKNKPQKDQQTQQGQKPQQQSKVPNAKQQKAAFDEFADIVVTAQDIAGLDEEVNIGEAESAPPEDKPRQTRPRFAPDPQSEISVSEDDVEQIGPEDKTDDIIEDALEQISIYDAINLLEMLVGIYKQREVPRQLSKLDMIMDRLGLIAYFPQLGEAQSKALDTTQYVSTRLEDILAKLRGSIESSEADEWVGKEKEFSPETKAVQNDLESKQEAEEKKKEMRKQKADQKLERGDRSEVGQQAQEELGGPTPVQTVEPVQVR